MAVKERLSRLVTVKSAVTLALTLVFAYLAIRGKVTGQEFLNVYSIVFAFYFGTQAQKTRESSSQ